MLEHHQYIYTDCEAEIVDCLINGRNDINANHAKNYFDQALNKAKNIFSTSQIAHGLYLESLSELAAIEYDINKRTSLWLLLYNKTIDFLNLYPLNEDLVVLCANKIVSYIKEPFINKDFQSQNKALNILKGKLNSLITHKGVANSCQLLVSKAAVLRSHSYNQTTQESKKLMLEEAIRCVQKSLSISETWFGFLELGNCFWAVSNFEKNWNHITIK